MEPLTTSTPTPAGTIESSAPATPAAGTPARPSKLPMRIAVACVAALVLFIGSVVLLYYTWLPRQNPNAMLILIGSAEYNGAEVTVIPLAGTSGPISATMTPDDGYRLRFHVPPGLYHVTVTQKGRVIAAVDAETHAGYPPWGVRLRSTHPMTTTTRPAP